MTIKLINFLKKILFNPVRITAYALIQVILLNHFPSQNKNKNFKIWLATCSVIKKKIIFFLLLH